MSTKNRLLGCAALALVSVGTGLFAATPANAQQASDEAEASGFDDIIVTARRREENLQVAPVAVTAFSGDRLAELRPVNLQSLSSLAPNVVISPAVGAGSGANFAIRGIGVGDPSPYLDPPNALYIDGVLRARTSVSLMELGDVERVEMLRGPQGTLFGRNTSGGAISIVTRQPAGEFGGRQTVGVGSDNEFLWRTSIDTGEIGDSNIFGRFTYFHREIDGVVENPGVKSSRWPGAANNNGYAARLAGDWGNFDVDYAFDYTLNENDTYYDQITFVNNATLLAYFSASPNYGGAPFVVAPDRLDVFPNRIFPVQRAENWGHSVTAEWEVNDALSLKSITAYRQLRESRPFNTASQGLLLGRVTDASAPGGFAIREVTPLQTPLRNMNEFQWSQEFQALGSIGNVDYVGGIFVFNENLTEQNANFNTTVVNATTGTNRVATRLYRYRTDSYAAFGQLSWRPEAFDDRFELTGGVRYTEDTKAIEDQAFVNGVRNRFFVGEETFSNVSGLLSASYEWTPDVMTYVRASTGYKAGGFNPGSAVGPFDPELATSFEVGVKSEWMDRLRLNATVFYTEYRDLQIAGRVTDPVTGNRVTTLVSAGRANYTGVELEFNALLGAGFEIDGNAGYVEPEYQEFPFFDGVNTIDVSDEARFPWISNTTADLGVRYNFPWFTAGDLTGRVSVRYQSGRYFFALARVNVNNDRLRAPDQHFIDARLSWKVPLAEDSFADALRIDVYGDNLADEHPFMAAIDSTNYGSVVWGRGRQFGVQLTAEF